MCLGGLIVFENALFLFYYPAGSDVLLFSMIIAVFFGAFTIAKVRLAYQGKQISQLEAKHLRQETIALENEIELLHAQIEPHFLFNTLSNIVSLIEINPKLAENSLVNLTRLLRVKLDRSRDKNHTLGDELWLLKAYLELHKMRLGERLTYQFLPIGIEDDISFTNLAIPSLLVQPLVENAIQHGIEPSVKGGEVSIGLAFSDNGLLIKVTDTGLGFKALSSANLTHHSGIGLSNVRRRLHAIYADRAALSIVDNEPSGAIVTLTIPMEAC
jgi:sensor histidine kinase YesM